MRLQPGKGSSGAIFCGCSTLRVGACAEGAGHVEELQATWRGKHIHKHSSGTLPFPVQQPHEIFRFLDMAHPLLSPSASTLPLHHLWLSAFHLWSTERKGGQTPDWRRVCPNPVARWQDLSLPSHPPSPTLCSLGSRAGG